MKFWRGFAIAAIGAAVAGCATQRDQAQGGFEYLELEERPTIMTPEGMTPVVQAPDYRIPSIERTDGPVGPSSSIRAPRQVMPLVPGSRIEDGSRSARIWFDAIDDMPNVSEWVWDELVALVEEQELPIAEMQTMGFLQTETVQRNQGSRARGGFWSGLKRDRVEFTAEYALTIDMQAPSHGRSAMLEVDASNVRYFEDGRERQAPLNLQRELEASFLNELGMRMQHNFEAQRVAQVRATRALRHAESPQGDPAYALDTNFESGWVLMPGVFDYLGFELVDLNQTEGVYYVNYEPDGGRGFLSRLAFWRSQDEGMLNLPRGKGYKFQLDGQDGVLYIVISHRGEVLDEQTMDELFPVFAEAFSEHTD